MFWNKKEVVEEETKTELLDVHYVDGLGLKFIESITHTESESNGNMYLLTKAIEQASLEQRRTDKKLNLILDHLKLKYVPETETKEPAKLVEIEEIEKVYLGFPLGYVDRPISKKSRPKKKK